MCNLFLSEKPTFRAKWVNNYRTLLTHVVRLRMRIEKKEGRAFVYVRRYERAGQQEDSVNFTDNLTIVLWKTQLLFHNLWKMYFLSVVYQLLLVISRSLAPKSRKDCSEQLTSSWTLNVATF